MMLACCGMRTTVTLDDDIAAEVERLRRGDGLGVSAAINRLARRGLAQPDQREPFVQRTYSLGTKIDIANIGEVLGMLDEMEAEEARSAAG